MFLNHFFQVTSLIKSLLSQVMTVSKMLCLPVLCCISIQTFALIQFDDQNKDGALYLKSIANDLPASWAIEVSPNQELFVSYRKGTLARYSLDGTLKQTYDLKLDDLFYKGQGGLMAIAFHPNFDQQPWVYVSYSYGDDNANGLKVIRLKLRHTLESSNEPNQNDFIDKQVIFEQSTLRNTAVHYGARLAFMSDNSLLISTGDGFDFREQAQVLSSEMGKILRLSDTGEALSSNPYFANNDALSTIYSSGHRNPQGLIVLANNTVISHEHGPAGGDEINIIAPGNNYGWPVITQGKDYIGSLITPFTEYEGMQQPTYNWTPSIAPAGMVYYANTRIPQFNNALLVTSLKYKQLHVLDFNGINIKKETVFFANSQYRMRDIALSSDGRVFILADREQASILEVLSSQ